MATLSTEFGSDQNPNLPYMIPAQLPHRDPQIHYASKLQKSVRQWLALRRSNPTFYSLASVAWLARRRYKRWSIIFDEVCKDFGTMHGLNEHGFREALQRLHVRLAPGQVQALWR